MKFFLPDWDDRIDPGFDFLTERFSLVRNPYHDDLYGHEIFSERIYDGLLVSRMALGESGPKRDLVETFGMRNYLRLPSDLELFGDCGAFSYMRDPVPRYETEEIAEYYERLHFDYGVSVDHLIVSEYQDERQRRYNLTLTNAEDFLKVHRSQGYRFTPVGAVQGWNIPSYVEAAQALVALGYDYIALGGLTRSRTIEIESIVQAAIEAIPQSVRVHVFGIARMSLLPRFVKLGVTSIDSASPLRQAWLSPHENYYTPTRTYAAIRIPFANQERSKRYTLVGRSEARLAQLQAAEKEALAAVREYDRRERKLASTLSALMDYDRLLGRRLDGQTIQRRRDLYRETLRDRPWSNCSCAVCQELGVEIIIFRGNNRNRRRGFHNLLTVTKRLHNLVIGELPTRD